MSITVDTLSPPTQSTPPMSPSALTLRPTSNASGASVALLSPPSTTTLPFNDVNILVVTDTHGWVDGHGRHEPNLDANYGDVLSFYQRLKKSQESSVSDLWFVQNGDFVHGTLLGDDPPRYLIPILEKMPWDVVNLGNHDIQETVTVQELLKPGSFVDAWGPALVTSNIVLTSTGVPIGNRYRYLHGQHSTLLVFAFLYDLGEHDHSPLVRVEHVQNVVESDWFTSVVRERSSYDAILVLAHMGNRDPSAFTILHKLRDLVGSDVKIQFITGHTHTREHSYLDHLAFSFEPGRYLDTLGFVSFGVTQQTEPDFQFRFVDASQAAFRRHLGMENYMTPDGLDLQNFITHTNQAIGANEVVGSSPGRFRVEGYLNQTDSLLRLYMEHVIPTTFLLPTAGRNVLIHEIQYFVRYDLFPGIISVNDVYGVLPLDDTITKVATSIAGSRIQQLAQHLHSGQTFLNGTAYKVAYMTQDGRALEPDQTYELYTVTKEVSKALHLIGPGNAVQQVVPGVTVRKLWTQFITQSWPLDGMQDGQQQIQVVWDELVGSSIVQQGPVDYGMTTAPTEAPTTVETENSTSSPTTEPTLTPISGGASQVDLETVPPVLNSGIHIEVTEIIEGKESPNPTLGGVTGETTEATATTATATTGDAPSSSSVSNNRKRVLSRTSIGGIISIAVGTVIILIFTIVQIRQNRTHRRLQMIQLGTGSLKAYRHNDMVPRRTAASSFRRDPQTKSLIANREVV